MLWGWASGRSFLRDSEGRTLAVPLFCEEKMKETLAGGRDLFFVACCSQRLDDSFGEGGVEVVHGLDSHTLASAGCVDVGTVFDVDAYMVNARA